MVVKVIGIVVKVTAKAAVKVTLVEVVTVMLSAEIEVTLVKVCTTCKNTNNGCRNSSSKSSSNSG